jgi:hypothetical protein
VVSTIDVFCLLSIFYLFFRSPSPMDVSASRLQKILVMQYDRYGQTHDFRHTWPYS